MSDENPANDQNLSSAPKKRSTFLTVICILSFVAIGYGIISELVTIATFDPDTFAMVEAEFEDAMDEVGDDNPAAGFLEGIMDMGRDAIEHQITLSWIGVAGNLLCLFGVIMMWRLRKPGYYIYLIGQFGPLIAAVVLVSGLALFGLIWLIIFPILYALNLKDMS